jgi:D-alanine-D-alanine ligase-like ATP-grasp enzyme
MKPKFLLGETLQKIAPQIGAEVIMEPNWGIVGQINFKNGKKSYFRYNTLDLNPMGSSEIAKDKDYANFFMEKMGYKIVPNSKTFFSERWAKAIKAKNRAIDDAYNYAKKIGFPVIVKPNSGSQGSGVALVRDKYEFYSAFQNILLFDKVVVVQSAVAGRDYRLVVLDDKIISAYERIPLNVVGDGKSTVIKLLEKKQEDFEKEGRDTKIELGDSRIILNLRHRGMNFRTILAKNSKLYLLNNANLSTGGDSVDVTNIVHQSFKDIAISLTKDMGLRLCGVDLMINGDIKRDIKSVLSGYYILEINSAPGLDHYSKGGKEQEKIVENLYLEVLKHLERKL